MKDRIVEEEQASTQRVPVDVPMELYERMNKCIAYGSRTRLIIAMLENFLSLAERAPQYREILAGMIIEGKVKFSIPMFDKVLEDDTERS